MHCIRIEPLPFIEYPHSTSGSESVSDLNDVKSEDLDRDDDWETLRNRYTGDESDNEEGRDEEDGYFTPVEEDMNVSVGRVERARVRVIRGRDLRGQQTKELVAGFDVDDCSTRAQRWGAGTPQRSATLCSPSSGEYGESEASDTSSTSQSISALHEGLPSIKTPRDSSMFTLPNIPLQLSLSDAISEELDCRSSLSSCLSSEHETLSSSRPSIDSSRSTGSVSPIDGPAMPLNGCLVRRASSTDRPKKRISFQLHVARNDDYDESNDASPPLPAMDQYQPPFSITERQFPLRGCSNDVDQRRQTISSSQTPMQGYSQRNYPCESYLDGFTATKRAIINVAPLSGTTPLGASQIGLSTTVINETGIVKPANQKPRRWEMLKARHDDQDRLSSRPERIDEDIIQQRHERVQDALQRIEDAVHQLNQLTIHHTLPKYTAHSTGRVDTPTGVYESPPCRRVGLDYVDVLRSNTGFSSEHQSRMVRPDVIRIISTPQAIARERRHTGSSKCTSARSATTSASIKPNAGPSSPSYSSLPPNFSRPLSYAPAAPSQVYATYSPPSPAGPAVGVTVRSPQCPKASERPDTAELHHHESRTTHETATSSQNPRHHAWTLQKRVLAQLCDSTLAAKRPDLCLVWSAIPRSNPNIVRAYGHKQAELLRRYEHLQQRVPVRSARPASRLSSPLIFYQRRSRSCLLVRNLRRSFRKVSCLAKPRTWLGHSKARGRVL